MSKIAIGEAVNKMSEGPRIEVEVINELKTIVEGTHIEQLHQRDQKPHIPTPQQDYI